MRLGTFTGVWDRKNEGFCETNMCTKTKLYKNKIKGGRRKSTRIKLRIKAKNKKINI